MLEQCGDPHPAPRPAPATHALQRPTSDGESNDEEEEENDEADVDGDEHCNLEPAQIHTTTSRHDDWLHRGSLLADLPWLVDMMRVRRVRKPTQANADHSQFFFFDDH